MDQQDFLMNLTDRIFVATLAVLALAVLIIERNKMLGTPSCIPVPAGRRLLQRMNVPHFRYRDATLGTVADENASGEYQ